VRAIAVEIRYRASRQRGLLSSPLPSSVPHPLHSWRPWDRVPRESAAAGPARGTRRREIDTAKKASSIPIEHVAVEGHPALQAVYKHDGGRQLASVRLPEFYEYEHSIQAEITDMARAVVFLFLIVAVATISKWNRGTIYCSGVCE